MNCPEVANTLPVRIALRRRADLVVNEQTARGVSMWVVKDPLVLKYYRFSEEEFTIWSLLDGRATDTAISSELQARFPLCELDEIDVRSFAESLYLNGLAIGDVPGQGQHLLARRKKRQQQRFLQTCLNLLSIRFRGIDLTWFLNLLYPLFRWFFCRTAIFVVAAIAAVASAIAFLNFDLLSSQVLTMHEFFGPGSWLLLACTLAITKMLHELGHALACKHCGGECHEIGVMLLVLTPCLYCDVSDSWLLPNKWHRAAIAAAGMYVEVTLASIAMFVWWLSAPGVLHYLSLQVILICSVSTLLFNGNPLTRYDGYYILTDLVEMPNLRQQSRAALKTLLVRICIGLSDPADEAESHSPWLIVYGIASLIYRWMLLAGILWFLHGFFEERGLEVCWHLIATLTIGSAVLMPLWNFICYVLQQEVLTQMNRKRLLVTGSVIALALGTFFLVPFPQRVVCTFETRARHSVPIYAAHDAAVECVHIVPGQSVVARERLADLQNLDLQLEVARLTSEKSSQSFRVMNLKYERFQDEEAMESLPQATEMLAATNEQLKERQADLATMTILAPHSGIVLAPPRREHPSEAKVLPVWSGTPLDKVNQGAILRAGEVICEIVSPNQWEAVLIIDQAEIENVQAGQSVRLLLDAMPLTSMNGKIAEIAQEKLDVSPESLSIQAGGQLPTHTDRLGIAHPSSASYSARVPIENSATSLAVGLRGTARISVGNATLASRLWQYLCRTFYLS